MQNKISICLNDTVCNGNCKYCFAGYQRSHEIKRDDDFDYGHLIESIKIYQSRDEGIGDLDFSLWGGEPTVNKHFLSLINILNEEFNNPPIRMVTNGYNLVEALEKTPENVVYQISNDAFYQEQTRGKQYLNDDNFSKSISKYAQQGRITGFQTVVTSETQDVMKNFEYMMNWFEKYNVNVSYGFMCCKTYSSDEDSLIFTDENSDTLRTTMLELWLTLLKKSNTDSKAVHHLIDMFVGELPQVFGSRMTVDFPCPTFTYKRVFDLNGQRWAFPHDFESNMSNRESVTRVDEPYWKCADCSFRLSCRGICCGAFKEVKERNCHSLWIWHSAIRKAVLATLPQESLEEVSDAEIMQTFRCS